jgi:hypothetical protein
MTLQQAITILTDLLGECPQFSPDLRRQAVKLGIEPLKRIAEYQLAHLGLHFTPMPSETNK